MEKLKNFLIENNFKYDTYYQDGNKLHYLKVFNKDNCTWFHPIINKKTIVTPILAMTQKENKDEYYVLFGCYCDGGSNETYSKLHELTYQLSEYIVGELNLSNIEKKFITFKEETKKIIK